MASSRGRQSCDGSLLQEPQTDADTSMDLFVTCAPRARLVSSGKPATHMTLTRSLVTPISQQPLSCLPIDSWWRSPGPHRTLAAEQGRARDATHALARPQHGRPAPLRAAPVPAHRHERVCAARLRHGPAHRDPARYGRTQHRAPRLLRFAAPSRLRTRGAPRTPARLDNRDGPA